MPSEISSYNNGLQAGSRFPRTEQLRKRNRRVALIALFVALLLLAGSAIYIAFWGGTNKGPMQPYTSVPTASGRGSAA